jgi:hypothetical protein
MTPQDLVRTLLQTNEEQGQQLLQTHVPVFSLVALGKLVYLVKKEADHCWNHDVQRSFILAGYLLFIGDLTRNKYYHALGLMARGDALRRMDCDQEALPFLDAAGEEFLSIDDEVGWARTRIGRVSACLRLNRTTEKSLCVMENCCVPGKSTLTRLLCILSWGNTMLPCTSLIELLRRIS